MDSPHQQQQQQQTWSPPQHAFTSTSVSDSDYRDTVAQLIALLDDPELIEMNGDAAEPESEDGEATTSDVYTSESLNGDANDSVASSADIAAEAGTTVDGIDHRAPSEATAAVEHTKSTERSTSLRRATAGSARQMAASKAKSAAKVQASVTPALTMTVTTLATLSSSADDARRESNRLKVRRLYYRKLDRLNTLRAHVTSLEDNLERLKLVQASTDLSVVVTNSTPTTSSIDYTGLLQQLSSAKQRLQNENEHLRQLVSQYIRSMHSVSVKLMELYAPQTTYLKIKAVTRRECVELRRRTLKHVRKFAHNRSLSLFTDAGSFCGWQSLHLVQDKVFQFIVEKSVPNVRCERFAQLIWSVLIDPKRFMRLYSLAVGMKCYVLQTVDDDNVVVFHEFRTMNPLEERPTVIRTIQLISRIHTDSGGSIISLTCLDRDKWVLDEPETYQEAIVWNDLSCWIQFQDIPNSSDCICVFGGFVPIFGANVSFWAVEIVQLAVRCENVTIGAASFSLQSTTATPGVEGGNDDELG